MAADSLNITIRMLEQGPRISCERIAISDALRQHPQKQALIAEARAALERFEKQGVKGTQCQ
jgi:hypothetical protein